MKITITLSEAEARLLLANRLNVPVREEMGRAGPHPDMRKEGLRERRERP